jgi:CheY-like chemotaxis protein
VEIKRGAKKRWADKVVLVADDTAAIRKKVVASLVSAGFTKCSEAEDGQQAVQVAKRIKPHLIILDLSMPVMNGLAAALKLRKILPKTPIILFSLYADALSKKDASKAGVTLVLSKGAPLPELVEKARSLLGK